MTQQPPRVREKAPSAEALAREASGTTAAPAEAPVSDAPKKPARGGRGRGRQASKEVTRERGERAGAETPKPARTRAPRAAADGAKEAARTDRSPAPVAAPAEAAAGEAEGDAREPAYAGGTRKRRGRAPRRKPRRSPSVERVMLVHTGPRGVQIGVLEKDQIVEHYVAHHEDRSLVGNIYLGRVQNVLPGMEASFVDIGEARNGVLYAGEVGIAGDEGDEIPRIETVLKAGQPIVVQVTKDPMRAKGARLTAMVSLAGRHLVLVPGASTTGVSRRIPDQERERLRGIVGELRPADHGLIARTAAEGASRDDLERDLGRLLESWAEVQEQSRRAKAPALLYTEPELELRVIRDLFNQDVSKCVIDDAKLATELEDYVRSTSPHLADRLEAYRGGVPLFEEYRVAEQIRKSLDRRVWLPSGGHIVVDRAEAMTVIDVNTGKFVGKSTLEETVFRTNKEAAIEIARQLRLRDIGGIIVIDFIDMENASNRDELARVFRDEVGRDRTRTQVYEISQLGLVQMTRKNVSAGIVEAFSDTCPTCEGRGILIHDVD